MSDYINALWLSHKPTFSLSLSLSIYTRCAVQRAVIKPQTHNTKPPVFMTTSPMCPHSSYRQTRSQSLLSDLGHRQRLAGPGSQIRARRQRRRRGR